MSMEKIIPTDIELVNIFGVNDNNLKYIKSMFPLLKINVRGNIIYIDGNDKEANEVIRILYEMLKMSLNKEVIETTDVELLSKINYESSTNGKKMSSIDIIDNKTIKVKNVNQYKYLDIISNSTITFGIGPAGTGKTFLAVASAVKMYAENKIRKIVLTRPAVEAGERLGYLPGDLSQKIDPYLVPLFDSLEHFFGNDNLGYLIEKRNIEIVPLAYMRGRTLNDACIILDEAQNATVNQIKMFLTRLGENSKVIITGDESQIDLYKKALELFDASRYSEALEAFRELIITFPEGDYSADAYFWSGELYLAQNLLEDARENYLVVADEFIEHNRAPDSLYKLGVIEKILLNEETSLSHFSRLIKEYPDTGAAELAKKSIETSTQE